MKMLIVKKCQETEAVLLLGTPERGWLSTRAVFLPCKDWKFFLFTLAPHATITIFA
jgi:hypothetical protein